MELEIIALLKKISLQLEETKKTQDEISKELIALKLDIGSYQEEGLKDLEARFLQTLGLNIQ